MAASLKDLLVTNLGLMPEKCFDRMIANYYMGGPCLNLVLNKTVGIFILLDILLGQMPQLLKVLWRGSAAGLSLTASLLQLYALSCPVVFAVANNFPLFAWAERLITLVQTAALVFFILCYRGESLKGFLLLLGYSGLMFLLGSRTPAAVATKLQASSLPSLVVSKGLQARTNYCNGHTGQLSSVSVFLSWTSSLSLLYVSLQNSEGSLETLSHFLLACLSCVLLAQVLCFRNSTVINKEKSE